MKKRKLKEFEKNLIKKVNRNWPYYSMKTKQIVKDLEKIRLK